MTDLKCSHHKWIFYIKICDLLENLALDVKKDLLLTSASDLTFQMFFMYRLDNDWLSGLYLKTTGIQDLLKCKIVFLKIVFNAFLALYKKVGKKLN